METEPLLFEDTDYTLVVGHPYFRHAETRPLRVQFHYNFADYMGFLRWAEAFEHLLVRVDLCVDLYGNPIRVPEHRYYRLRRHGKSCFLREEPELSPTGTTKHKGVIYFEADDNVTPQVGFLRKLFALVHEGND